uniref:RING H2 finger protein n=1 Tax=Clandestinovirus TaxID=2831644 RepID=A0A8F8PK28_9VIRU|nr:RING H2 finger protein [Clandestinovirus]
MSSKKTSKKDTKSKSPEPICAITLVPLSQLSDEDKMFLPCSHGFDKKAILTHIKKVSAECPVCRTSIHVTASELGLTTETPESEKVTKCAKEIEDDDSEMEDDDDEDDADSATLDSEEPRSEETGSIGSLRDFIEDDEEDEASVDDEEVDYVPTDEEEDDTISSEVDSDEEEYESDSKDDSSEEDDEAETD